jgi:hypothetical protein
MITNNKLSKLNSQNNFLAYKGTKNENVLFIGSCRITPIMFYFNQRFPEYNVYGIYVPYWTDTSKLCRNSIQKILYNTNIIITESVKNYSILNTYKTLENNFFNTFDTNATQIKISNLELHMYIHELTNLFKIPAENMSNYFEQSKNKLKSSLINKNQKFIWNFIEDHFQSLKLFTTHNHPCRVLSILTFMFICNIMNTEVSINFINQISRYDFLEENAKPITQLDIDRYNFVFNTRIFDNNVLEDESFLYQPTESEKVLSYSTMESILDYTKQI